MCGYLFIYLFIYFNINNIYYYLSVYLFVFKKHLTLKQLLLVVALVLIIQNK